MLRFTSGQFEIGAVAGLIAECLRGIFREKFGSAPLAFIALVAPSIGAGALVAQYAIYH
jgi:hypothetical protein